MTLLYIKFKCQWLEIMEITIIYILREVKFKIAYYLNYALIKRNKIIIGDEAF